MHAIKEQIKNKNTSCDYFLQARAATREQPIESWELKRASRDEVNDASIMTHLRGEKRQKDDVISGESVRGMTQLVG